VSSHSSPPSCPVCGFQWHLIARDEVAPRVTYAVERMGRAMMNAGARSATRPEPERWSVLEYAGHLRDVLLTIRERTILACVVDHPTGTPLYRDERVDLGFYRGDSPDVVARDLQTAASLFLRTFAALPPDALRRPILYSPVNHLDVDVLWMGAQAVHESEHHLSDVLDNLAALEP
jgi:hypothetical protein